MPCACALCLQEKEKEKEKKKKHGQNLKDIIMQCLKFVNSGTNFGTDFTFKTLKCGIFSENVAIFQKNVAILPKNVAILLKNVAIFPNILWQFAILGRTGTEGPSQNSRI